MEAKLLKINELPDVARDFGPPRYEAIIVPIKRSNNRTYLDMWAAQIILRDGEEIRITRRRFKTQWTLWLLKRVSSERVMQKTGIKKCI